MFPVLRGTRRTGIRPLSVCIVFSFCSTPADAGVVAPSCSPLVSPTGVSTEDSSEADEDGEDNSSLVDVCLVSIPLPGMWFRLEALIFSLVLF